MGFMDIIDPALDRIKQILNLEQSSYKEPSEYNPADNDNTDDEASVNLYSGLYVGNDLGSASGFDLDDFIRNKLNLDPDQLDVFLEKTSNPSVLRRIHYPRRIFRPEDKTAATLA